MEEKKGGTEGVEEEMNEEERKKYKRMEEMNEEEKKKYKRMEEMNEEERKKVLEGRKRENKKKRKEERRKNHWKKQREKQRTKKNKPRRRNVLFFLSFLLKNLFLMSRKKKWNEEWQEKRVEEINWGEGPTVVVDLSWCESQPEKEVRTIAQQVAFVYSANKNGEKPLKTFLVGLKGGVEEELEKRSGFGKWKFFKERRSLLEVFGERREELVYLTPDSPNTMEEVDKGKVYVIGGIADNSNSMPKATFNFATLNQIQTCKLPLKLYLQDVNRTVLNINHTFEILMRKNGGENWKEILEKVVPKRKGFRKRKREQIGEEKGEVGGSQQGEGEANGEKEGERSNEKEANQQEEGEKEANQEKEGDNSLI